MDPWCTPMRDNRTMGAGTKQPKPLPQSPVRGLAAVAQKFREWEARNRIIEELERLGIPRQDWPAYVQRPAKPDFSASHRFECFQPPDIDLLRESMRDWVKKADAAWGRYRDRQVRLFAFLVEKGVDEPIPDKRSRGPGKKGRNMAIDARYEWAARRLIGVAWKVIAIDAGLAESRVRMAATEVLRIAGWIQ